MANPIFADVDVLPHSSHNKTRHQWTSHNHHHHDNTKPISTHIDVNIDNIGGENTTTIITTLPQVFDYFHEADKSSQNNTENHTSTAVVFDVPHNFEFLPLEERLHEEDTTFKNPLYDGNFPKKPMNSAGDGKSEKTKEILLLPKNKPTGKSLGSPRGRSLDSIDSDLENIPKSIGDLEDGIWEVRKTPCSVTCGIGE